MDGARKPRILLSIMQCANFDQFGDAASLMTAISAGFGYFECERLLKPSGIELMNLPPKSTIEIGVLRRDRAKGQKVLACQGLIALSAVPLAPTSEDDRLAWEGWLGLLGTEVSLKSQSPERLFQMCVEFGSTSRPRLFVKLQYWDERPREARPLSLSRGPQSLTSGAASPCTGSTYSVRRSSPRASSFSPIWGRSNSVEPRDRAPRPALGLRDGPLTRDIAAASEADAPPVPSPSSWSPPAQSSGLGTIPKPKVTIGRGSVTPQKRDSSVAERDSARLASRLHVSMKQITDLQRQMKELERDNLRLHETEHKREAYQREFFEQMKPLLAQFGSMPRPSDRLSAEEQFADMIACLSAAKASDPLQLLETAMSKIVKGGEGFQEWFNELSAETRALLQRSDVVASHVSDPFQRHCYTPVTSDPVDCLLAAHLLKLDVEPPFVRLEPGIYQCDRQRVSCRIDHGRVLVRRIPDQGFFSGPSLGASDIELSMFLRGRQSALVTAN